MKNKLCIFGASGMVGGAVLRHALNNPMPDIPDLLFPSRSQVNLFNRRQVRDFMRNHRPTHVVLAAARVGGIRDNRLHPVEFLSENLQIQTNVIDACYEFDVEKLVFLGSSCVYPREALSPISPSALLTGPFESTNRSYALAKSAGVELCRAYREQYGKNFISVMPCNVYGPGDNFHPGSSHLMAALIRRVHQAREVGAKSIVLWGDGTPLREFLHCDDVAGGIMFALENYNGEQPLNLGADQDHSVREWAELVSYSLNWDVEIRFNGCPGENGTPRKLMDSSVIRGMGWKPEVDYVEGIQDAHAWAVKNKRI